MFLNTNFQLSNEILFWQLCEKGQLHEIEAFLENYNTISKKTLSFGLLICCKNFKILSDHQDIVQVLLQKGANVNQPEIETGISPLMYAIFKNSYQLAEILIDNKVNFDLKDKTGKTVLIYLLESKEPETVDLSFLVIQQMSKDQLNGSDNFSPILESVKHNFQNIVECLIAKGVRLDARDNLTGNGLLHFAALNESESLISLLLKSGLKNANNLNKELKLPCELTKNHDLINLLKSSDKNEAKVG